MMILGDALTSLKKYQDAATCYDELIKLDSEDSDAYY